MSRLVLLSLFMVACNGDTPETDPVETDEPTPTPTPAPSEKVWSVAADEVEGGVMLSAWTQNGDTVIAGGSYGVTGSLWRYDGEALCLEENVADGALWWVHGRSDTDWYAVGDKGIIVHSVDGVRTREDLPTDTITIFGVYDDGSAVWAVGGHVRDGMTGAIWRKEDGGTWTLVAEPDSLAFKVWDGWVVGDGFAWWWDGTDFVDRTPDDAPLLRTVRGRSADDVWAVGGEQIPEFWHWDGSSWSQPATEPRCVSQALNGVYTSPEDDVWVSGGYGTAAGFDETAWSCADFPVTGKHFHAVWPHGDEMLMLGGNLTSTSLHTGTIARYATADTPEMTITTCP